MDGIAGGGGGGDPARTAGEGGGGESLLALHPWVPRRRLDVNEYMRLAEVGVLGEDDRVELIEGELVAMSPKGSPHVGAVMALNRLLTRAAGDRAMVAVQDPVRLGDHSEPEPDLLLLRPDAHGYRLRKPAPADVLLLVEVADSSLRYDRGVKRALYARHGVLEVWIVDLDGGAVEVCRAPGPEGHASDAREGPGAGWSRSARPARASRWPTSSAETPARPLGGGLAVARPAPRRYTPARMTWVDGVLLAVLAVSGLAAYARGLVAEVLGVGAWVGALALAFAALPGMRAALAGRIAEPWLLDAVAVGGVFLAALVALKLVIGWVAGRVRASALGGVDRALGTVFGLARGAFLAAIAYIAAGLFAPQPATWPEPVREARALPLVADGARWLADRMPPGYRPAVPPAPDRPLPPLEELLRPPARPRAA